MRWEIPVQTAEERAKIHAELGNVLEAIKQRDYGVVRMLGEGSYAKVFEVIYAGSQIPKRYGKRFAMKVIFRAKASKNYTEKFWPRELEVMKTIVHPNIIRTKDIIEVKDKNIILVVMEYAGGGTLADVLGSEALPEAKARYIISPIFAALEYLHHRNIAHRDIKLENILMTNEGEAKLADFSYSTICSVTDGGHVELSNTHCGTPCYFSPEIIKNEPYNPLASDVWSLGVCLYILTNNRLPFKYDPQNMQAMLRHQLKREWHFAKQYENILSRDLKDLLSRMLEPNPKKRITMKEAIRHLWITKGDLE